MILKEVIKHLTQNNQLKENYLEVLTTHNLCALDLSVYDKYAVPGNLRLPTKNCPVINLPTLSTADHPLTITGLEEYIFRMKLDFNFDLFVFLYNTLNH